MLGDRAGWGIIAILMALNAGVSSGNEFSLAHPGHITKDEYADDFAQNQSAFSHEFIETDTGLVSGECLDCKPLESDWLDSGCVECSTTGGCVHHRFLRSLLDTVHHNDDDCTFGNGPDPIDLVPFMIGDGTSGRGTQITFDSVSNPALVNLTQVDILADRGIKVADNNKALPQTRFYYQYNYFDSAIRAFPNGPDTIRQSSLNRHTVGLEKSFWGDRHSVEVRAPFFGNRNLVGSDFDVEVTDFDNLSVIYKYLLPLEASDHGVAVAGVGFNIPTGSDTSGTIPGVTYTIENESLRILPYLGLLAVEDNNFVQMFFQFDIAANGDSVMAGLVSQPQQNIGTLEGQSLFYVDLSFGQWIFPDHFPKCGMSGVAAMIELHYATTIQDADRVVGVLGDTNFRIRNEANRLNILNFSGGLDFAFGRRLLLGIAGMLPIRSADNRSFDAQAQVRVNYRF